jgi:hypothetical protein
MNSLVLIRNDLTEIVQALDVHCFWTTQKSA